MSVLKNTHIFLISRFSEFKKMDTADKLLLEAIIDSKFVFSEIFFKRNAIKSKLDPWTVMDRLLYSSATCQVWSGSEQISSSER